MREGRAGQWADGRLVRQRVWQGEWHTQGVKNGIGSGNVQDDEVGGGKAEA